MARKLLGKTKATKKASDSMPAPRVQASSASRAKPVMRDSSVKPLTESSFLQHQRPSLGTSFFTSGSMRATMIFTPAGLGCMPSA